MTRLQMHFCLMLKLLNEQKTTSLLSSRSLHGSHTAGCQAKSFSARTDSENESKETRSALKQQIVLYTVLCTVYSILYCAVIYIYYIFFNKLNNLTFCALSSPWKRDNQISRFLVLVLVKQYICMHTYEHLCQSSSVLGGKPDQKELLCKKVLFLPGSKLQFELRGRTQEDFQETIRS